MRHARAGALTPVLALALAACSGVGGIGGDRTPVLTDAQEVIANAAIGPSELTVLARIPRERTYLPGDPIALTVTVSQDAHVAVLRVRANGETTLIFPNRAHPTSLVSAAAPAQIPGPDDSYRIAAGRPGNELFEVIASTGGTSWLFSRAATGTDPFADLGGTTRALAKDIASSVHPPAAATHLIVHVATE